MDEYSASSSTSRQAQNNRSREPLMCYNHITKTISKYCPESQVWKPVSEEAAAALKIKPEELPHWRENGNTCSPDNNYTGVARPVADKSDKTPGSATWPRETADSTIPASALRDVDQNEQVVKVGRVSSGKPISVEANDRSPNTSRSSSASVTFSTPETERSPRCALRRSNAIRMPRRGSPHPNGHATRPSSSTGSRRFSSASASSEEIYDPARGHGRVLSARHTYELRVACFKLLQRVKEKEILQEVTPTPRCPELGFREKLKMKCQSLKDRVCRDVDDEDDEDEDGAFGAALCRQ